MSISRLRLRKLALIFMPNFSLPSVLRSAGFPQFPHLRQYWHCFLTIRLRWVPRLCPGHSPNLICAVAPRPFLSGPAELHLSSASESACDPPSCRVQFRVQEGIQHGVPPFLHHDLQTPRNSRARSSPGPRAPGSSSASLSFRNHCDPDHLLFLQSAILFADDFERLHCSLHLGLFAAAPGL